MQSGQEPDKHNENKSAQNTSFYSLSDLNDLLYKIFLWSLVFNHNPNKPISQQTLFSPPLSFEDTKSTLQPDQDHDTQCDRSVREVHENYTELHGQGTVRSYSPF